MKCTRCQYPLWNLKDRRCPECGQDFAPSQFTFVPRAVRFCCPHCGQHYFGTGVDGHLVPRAFTCVTCSASIQMDEMVLAPVEGQDATIESAPWLRRDRAFPVRWFRTLGGGLGVPRRHIKQIPPESSVVRALWFAVFTILISAALGMVGLLAILTVASTVGGPPSALGHLVLAVAIAYIAAVSVLVVWLGVWILATHFILVITGQTAGGLRRTTQCLTYASAPNILFAVPCLSFYLWPVVALWSAISGAIMLIHGQKVSTARAVVAAVTPPLILGTALASLIIGLLIPAIQTGIMAAGNIASQASSTLQGMRAQTLCMSLNARALTAGAYPLHAVELLDDGSVSAGDFSLSTNPIAGSSAIVGDTTLGEVETLPPARRASAIRILAAAQPASVIAHRVGDFVFTYHGLQPGSADRGLWVFIADVPPMVQPPASPGAPPGIQPAFLAGTAGGQIIPISQSGLGQSLIDQNNLRASYGLPPLPDPATVTPASPALGPK